jgi:hypothetical protein
MKPSVRRPLQRCGKMTKIVQKGERRLLRGPSPEDARINRSSVTVQSWEPTKVKYAVGKACDQLRCSCCSQFQKALLAHVIGPVRAHHSLSEQIQRVLRLVKRHNQNSPLTPSQPWLSARTSVFQRARRVSRRRPTPSRRRTGTTSRLLALSRSESKTPRLDIARPHALQWTEF